MLHCVAEEARSESFGVRQEGYLNFPVKGLDHQISHRLNADFVAPFLELSAFDQGVGAEVGAGKAIGREDGDSEVGLLDRYRFEKYTGRRLRGAVG